MSQGVECYSCLPKTAWPPTSSCHSTHTAVGEALLQLGSAEDVCMACHDGSITTTYDVKNGLIGDTTMRTAGGLFGDSTSNSAMSKTNHNVSGSMSIYAAPGGPGTPGTFTSTHKEFDFSQVKRKSMTLGNLKLI